MLFLRGHTGIRSLKASRSQVIRRRTLSVLYASAFLLGLRSSLEAQSSYTPYEFAVLAGVYGSEDGPSTMVHLNWVAAVAVDSNGTVYFSDDPGRVRKVTPAGMVTTVAGIFGQTGKVDGIGPVARFTNVTNLAVGADGNIYVTDGSAIRKMSPGGAVATLAGTADVNGSADGPGAAALFNGPMGVAADQNGNVYVSDSENQAIREIDPSGVVTTLAGAAGAVGSADGTGASARFHFPHSLVIDANGNLEKAAIRQSSGDPELDQASLDILKLASPFDPFPPELERQYHVLRFAYEWEFVGGRVQAGGVSAVP